jgi:hypothetical protein
MKKGIEPENRGNNLNKNFIEGVFLFNMHHFVLQNLFPKIRIQCDGILPEKIFKVRKRSFG